VIRQAPEIEDFQQRLSESLRQDTARGQTVALAKGEHAYVCGDPGETVYYLKRGQIKLTVVSPAGRECLLAILVPGDIFGELCLAGLSRRQETATAMAKSQVTAIPCTHFLGRLSRDALLEGLVQYLALRVADQQEVIAQLVTADSEQRLGAVLLDLARRLGKQDPRSIRIEQRITHEELAAMVGTTRQRVCGFMQHFCAQGLIEFSAEHHLIVKEGKLAEYLAHLAGWISCIWIWMATS
jgi:CRP/FNR family transcriptional regulator, cyclic AMP receptor protein